MVKFPIFISWRVSIFLSSALKPSGDPSYEGSCQLRGGSWRILFYSWHPVTECSKPGENDCLGMWGCTALYPVELSPLPNTTFPDLIPILSLSWEPYLWTPAYSLEPPKCNRCQDLYFHLLNLSYLYFLWQK